MLRYDVKTLYLLVIFDILRQKEFKNETIMIKIIIKNTRIMII